MANEPAGGTAVLAQPAEEAQQSLHCPMLADPEQALAARVELLTDLLLVAIGESAVLDLGVRR